MTPRSESSRSVGVPAGAAMATRKELHFSFHKQSEWVYEFTHVNAYGFFYVGVYVCVCACVSWNQHARRLDSLGHHLSCPLQDLDPSQWPP